MIHRLYVDNFRSLVDFTWEPGAETLVLGHNGSGKSSVLEVLDILQYLCLGYHYNPQIVSAEDRTSWLDIPTITFKVSVDVNGVYYRYHLALEFEMGRIVIVFETLTADNQPIFKRDSKKVRLSSFNHQSNSSFPIGQTQSVVSIIGEELGGEAVAPFREYMEGLLYLKPSPTFLYAHKTGTTSRPEASLSDLVPWYVHLSKDTQFVAAVAERLRELWPEMIEIRTPEFSPDVYDFILRVNGGAEEGQIHEVSFRSLSDGERILVALYVIAAYQRVSSPTTIIIDEPDNFVSIREIQPWLLAMLDERPEGGQLLFVSHNEEIIQTMGRENVAYFARKDHLSPTTVRSITSEETDVAPLRDLLRRGWLDE